MTPEDAIYTFLNSGLEVLQLENWVIEKQQGDVDPDDAAAQDRSRVLEASHP